MALPLSYNVRNVRNRWQVTLLAISGIALVVAVFTVLMSMSEGFAMALRTTGRTDNAIANLKSAAACGVANGAIGYLNTDWGDIGHLQYLPISYLGFAAGAAY